MTDEILAGNPGTATQEPVVSPAPTGPTQGKSRPEQMFSREKVNELMRRRIERSHKAFFTRYGVNNLEELDNLVGQAKSYGPLKERFDELDKNHTDLTTNHTDLQKRYAYRVCNIDDKRYNDIETYFKGKNIPIDENSLAEELKTHPEWARKAGVVQSIGAEATPSLEADERELASKIFGVKITKKRG